MTVCRRESRSWLVRPMGVVVIDVVADKSFELGSVPDDRCMGIRSPPQPPNHIGPTRSHTAN